jgi:hypothetical protein
LEEDMHISDPLITGALLAVFTAIQAWINKGRIDALERRVDRGFEQLGAEIASLRSDLLHVALDRRRDD